jgi:hypothetical protein
VHALKISYPTKSRRPCHFPNQTQLSANRCSKGSLTYNTPSFHVKLSLYSISRQVIEEAKDKALILYNYTVQTVVVVVSFTLTMKLDVGETKLRKYEETISALRNRLDEMETRFYI